MRDHFQRYPLHHAARISGTTGLNMMKYLLSKGAAVNVYEIENETPLHLAIKYSSCTENVKYLLDNGAEINLFDEWGIVPTPILVAIKENNYEMCKLLILYGADLYLDSNLMNFCKGLDVKFLRLLNNAGLRFENVTITTRDSNIQNLIQLLQINPFNLQQLCRIQLRETFNKNYLRFVNNAKNVSYLLKQYLLFNSDND